MSCLDLALLLGEKVERASDTLPQTSTESLFAISGGRVVITSLFGTVTVAIGPAGCTGDVIANPTVGTSRSLRSAGTGLDSRNPGHITSLYEMSLTWEEATVGVTCHPLITPEGTIDLQTSASIAGEMSWTLTYVALDEGASVVAV